MVGIKVPNLSLLIFVTILFYTRSLILIFAPCHLLLDTQLSEEYHGVAGENILGYQNRPKLFLKFSGKKRKKKVFEEKMDLHFLFPQDFAISLAMTPFYTCFRYKILEQCEIKCPRVKENWISFSAKHNSKKNMSKLVILYMCTVDSTGEESLLFSQRWDFFSFSKWECSLSKYFRLC